VHTDQDKLLTKDSQQAFFTKDGKFLVSVGTQDLTLIDVQKEQIVSTHGFEQISISGLSTAPKYVVLVDKKAKDLYLLMVLKLPTFECVLQTELKFLRKEAFPMIKFDQDDSIAFRATQKNTIEVICMTTYSVLN